MRRENGKITDNYYWVYRIFHLPFGYPVMISGQTFQYAFRAQSHIWLCDAKAGSGMMKSLYSGPIRKICDNNWSKRVFRGRFNGVGFPIIKLGQEGLQSFTQNILFKVIRADEVLKQALTSLPSVSIRLSFPSPAHIKADVLITGHLCCCPRPCQNTFEWRPGRWAAIMLNTCSCVPLQKQTTTIILITALFRPLQQSSRPSSEDTWVSLTHHRDYLKNIVAIV